MKLTFKHAFVFTLLVVLISITYLSLSPQPKMVASNDKVGHFIAYGTLMMNLGILFANDNKKLMFSAVFAFIYGGLMEFGQYFVPGRSVSGLDLLANTGGVLIGYVFILLTGKRLRKFFRMNS